MIPPEERALSLCGLARAGNHRLLGRTQEQCCEECQPIADAIRAAEADAERRGALAEREALIARLAVNANVLADIGSDRVAAALREIIAAWEAELIRARADA